MGRLLKRDALLSSDIAIIGWTGW